MLMPKILDNKTKFVMALAFVVAAISSCYDHLHPPATPGGDPSDYPPLTDSKADAGR